MWSQTAGSPCACIACVTGTNAPDCAATLMAGPAETTAQNKNVTTRYALFIVLPPLVDGYELSGRALKLEISRSKNIRYFTLPGQITSAFTSTPRQYQQTQVSFNTL